MSRFFFDDGYIKNCNYLGEKSEADSERNAHAKSHDQVGHRRPFGDFGDSSTAWYFGVPPRSDDGHLLLLEGRTV